jgi:uncharacterized protein (UPF0332 family)
VPPIPRRNAERALTEAALLLGGGDTEGAYKRAYYAMYYAAQAALLGSGISEPQDGYKTHQSLIGAFGKHLVLSAQINPAFGRSINKVQWLRQIADYVGDPPSLEDATLAVAEAKAFVAATILPC